MTTGWGWFSTLLVICLPAAAAAECSAIFNGQDLNGWEVLGPAEFTVEGGTITGRSVDDRENSFLVTIEDYGDFQLELEFSFDPGTFNSGIQIRSARYPAPTTTDYRAFDNRIHQVTWAAGRVFGYQVEIDPSPRSWTGEIHDEGARGWLDTFDKTPAAVPVEADHWYRLRIRAEGPKIMTWLDGRKIADLTDGARSAGFIGLQVHGIRDTDQVGKAVRWRHLELCDL